MAESIIPIDKGAIIWEEEFNSLLDFNIPFTDPLKDSRVIVGRWAGNVTANAPVLGYQGFYIHQASSANYAVQIAVNISTDNKIYIRNKFNGTWGEWKSFTAS